MTHDETRKEQAEGRYSDVWVESRTVTEWVRTDG